MKCIYCGSTTNEFNESGICINCEEALEILSSTIVYKDILKGLIKAGWKNDNVAVCDRCGKGLKQNEICCHNNDDKSYCSSCFIGGNEDKEDR